MRRPEFWQLDGPTAKILAPFGWAYDAVGRIRRGLARPYRPPVPVLCVGNLVAGGAGKTPVAMALAEMLIADGSTPHFLTRGHGGSLTGPVAVDPSRHDAGAVGDEAPLLAEIAPCWVARDRAQGARAAVDSGADVIIMDDGFQNPGLAKDLSLIVIDGEIGFGNQRVIPAGPLRETLRAGMARADAAILIGSDTTGAEVALGGNLPVLRARFIPVPGTRPLHGCPVVAFAGIGRPEKFFTSLRETGCALKAVHGFPDHHVFAAHEIGAILEQAAALGATAMTTAKDAARLPAEARALVEVFDVALEWDSPDAVMSIIRRMIDEFQSRRDHDHG
jgi:tetraacyldisaccharide 4'-kinase